MTSKKPSAHPSLARLVERQMRNWELARAQRPAEPSPKDDDVEEFICVSRMVGVAEQEVTRRLGEELQWPVFDREILNAMAGDDGLRRRVYDAMDNRDLSWWEETLRPLVHGEFVPNDYFRKLCETLLSLARTGNCIFVGRGADLVLPAAHGYRVRLVGPRAACVDRFGVEHGLDWNEAKRRVEKLESERSEFIKHHFGVGEDDPSRYDLAINLDRFSPQHVVDLILEGRRVRATE